MIVLEDAFDLHPCHVTAGLAAWVRLQRSDSARQDEVGDGHALSESRLVAVPLSPVEPAEVVAHVPGRLDHVAVVHLTTGHARRVQQDHQQS